MAQDCAGIPLGPGMKGLQLLVDKSQADPWWAVASIVAHAGPITYDPQQKMVDVRIAPLGPGGVDTMPKAISVVAPYLKRERAARGVLTVTTWQVGMQLWTSRAAMYVVAADVFREFTAKGRKPQNIVHEQTRWEFIHALARRFTSDTPKLRDQLNRRKELGEEGLYPPGLVLPDEEKERKARIKAERLAAQSALPLNEKLEGTGDDRLVHPSSIEISEIYDDFAGIENDTGEGLSGPGGLEGLDASSPSSGIGTKSQNLLAEYLGDPEAVAADRHVTFYACRILNKVGELTKSRPRVVPLPMPISVLRHYKSLQLPNGATAKKIAAELAMAGKTPKQIESALKSKRREVMVPYKMTKTTSDFHRSDPITPELFDRVQAVIREQAVQCKVTAAQLQVGAWAFGACTSEQRPGGRGIYLFEGVPLLDCSGFEAARVR